MINNLLVGGKGDNSEKERERERSDDSFWFWFLRANVEYFLAANLSNIFLLPKTSWYGFDSNKFFMLLYIKNKNNNIN